ncbi:MAG: lipoyl(octanoyl) transferase LipB [Lutimonas sp.]
MMEKIELIELGLKGYQEAWDFQQKLHQGIIDIKLANRKRDSKEKNPNYFIFTEHPHVYTLGKSGDISNLLLNEAQLSEKGIQFVKTNRGGDITYHGPGQIVGYPILNLEDFSPDIHLYMRNLEEVMIRTLDEYGLKGSRSEGETGVWLDVGTPFARKICAMGVRTSRWVTMHGFALNVNANLGYFDHIIPCGIKGKAVTSLEAELNRKVSMDEVKSKILHHFSAIFDIAFIPAHTALSV